MFQEITGNSLLNTDNLTVCDCNGECFTYCSSVCTVEYPRVYYRVEERLLTLEDLSGLI